MIVDLHCHSTNSDGTWEVKRILKAAEEKKIEALCISDHDNLSGTQEAFHINEKEKIFKGTLVPGIEISTRVSGQKAHLLAYFPDLNQALNKDLMDVLDKIKNSRIIRMKKMIEKANQLGMEVSFEEVLEEAGKGIEGEKQPTDVISRPHLARVLYKKGYVESREAAFEKYLGDGKPLDTKRFTLKYNEWIDLIHRNNGIVVWAHPLHARNSINDLKKISFELTKAGIDGIEFFYDYTQKYHLETEFEQEGLEFLKVLISERKLIRTAGGDFHGDVGRLGMELPRKDFTAFLSKLQFVP